MKTLGLASNPNTHYNYFTYHTIHSFTPTTTPTCRHLVKVHPNLLHVSLSYHQNLITNSKIPQQQHSIISNPHPLIHQLSSLITCTPTVT